MNGAEMILAERARQVADEGWTPEHDDAHDRGELRHAASCYIVAAGDDARPNFTPPDGWPFEAEAWKPSERIDDLVKAGALIAAEIDRLLRRGHTHGREPGVVPVDLREVIDFLNRREGTSHRLWLERHATAESIARRFAPERRNQQTREEARDGL